MASREGCKVIVASDEVSGDMEGRIVALEAGLGALELLPVWFGGILNTTHGSSGFFFSFFSFFFFFSSVGLIVKGAELGSGDGCNVVVGLMEVEGDCELVEAGVGNDVGSFDGGFLYFFPFFPSSGFADGATLKRRDGCDVANGTNETVGVVVGWVGKLGTKLVGLELDSFGAVLVGLGDGTCG